MITKLITASILTSALLIGCVPVEEQNTQIDQQLLTEYRKAIPSMSQMEASEVQRTTQALGDPAVLPAGSYEIVEGINGGVAALIGTLEAIVATEPTVYNSDTLEFVWGPFPNDDGVGYVAVYIRDAGEEDDLRYHFAFLRGIDNDMANLTPVIWGGTTPSEENEDHGVGLALYDFEANYAFEEAHNPDVANLETERGRVAFLFGAGPDEEDPTNEVGFVVASFRDFVSADEPNATPGDLDYMYGHYADNREGHTLDFLNYRAAMDVDDDASGIELVDVRMAFLDEGTGRGEAIVVGGNMEAGEVAALEECWDTSINQTFIRLAAASGDGAILLQEGDPANCGLFEASLAELGIPLLDDIDAELITGLDQLATTGVPAE